MRALEKSRGFTLIEMMIVVAIVAALLTMAVAVFRSQQSRSELSGQSLDLRALIHEARAEALATGHDVGVLVYPDFPVPGGGIGRVIVYSDGDRTFFSDAAPVNFQAYDPAVHPAGGQSEIIAIYDLPRGLVFGPAAGQAPSQLRAPYAALPVNADCTFCLGNGAGGRHGAIVFNFQGAARFLSANGAPTGALAGVVGGSVSLQSVSFQTELRTVAVVAATGAVRSIGYKL